MLPGGRIQQRRINRQGGELARFCARLAVQPFAAASQRLFSSSSRRTGVGASSLIGPIVLPEKICASTLDMVIDNRVLVENKATEKRFDSSH